jgi:hypothetical protein
VRVDIGFFRVIDAIGDRSCLHNRRHPQRRDLVEKSPAACRARRHRAIEQRGAGRLVDTQKVSEDRGLLAARHAADLVSGARQNPGPDLPDCVPLHERGMDLAVARLKVRGKCVIQIRQLGVGQAAERLQCRAAPRVLDLADNARSRFVWGELRQPPERKIGKR